VEGTGEEGPDSSILTGTGRALGASWWSQEAVLANPAVARPLDHIQGCPLQAFFAPTGAIWAHARGLLRSRRSYVSKWTAVFPSRWTRCGELTVQQVEPGEFTVGTFKVRTIRLRTRTTLGYAHAGGRSSMAYVTTTSSAGGH